MSRLLSLPGELRNRIWSEVSATSTWKSLLQSNRQVYQEARCFCHPSPGVSLDEIEFIIDSDYEHGVWLKYRIYWGNGKFPNCAFLAAQDGGDKTLSRLMRERNWKNMTFRYVAPSEGDYLGAFLMMFAKAQDVMRFFVRPYHRPEKGPRTRCRMFFDTQPEPLNAEKGSASNNFWEDRFDHPHLYNPVRRSQFLDYRGTPFFWEYFLLVPMRPLRTRIKEEPEIFFTHPPRQTYASFAQPYGRELVEELEEESDEEEEDGVEEIDVEVKENLFPPNMFTLWEEMRATAVDESISWWKRFLVGDDTYLPGENWTDTTREVLFTRIFGDLRNIYRYWDIYIDSYAGSADRVMDKLRLHRLKAMSCGTWQVEEMSAHWFEIDSISSCYPSNVLHAIFHPSAREEIQELRRSHEQLASLTWPPVERLPPDASSSDLQQLWLRAYPDGITFRSKNGWSVAQWRATSQEIAIRTPYVTSFGERWIGGVRLYWMCKPLCAVAWATVHNLLPGRWRVKMDEMRSGWHLVHEDEVEIPGTENSYTDPHGDGLWSYYFHDLTAEDWGVLEDDEQSSEDSDDDASDSSG